MDQHRALEEGAPESRTGDRAVGLGLFGLGLGLAEVMAAPQLSRWLLGSDTRRTRATLRAVGTREIATGFGLLTGRRPPGGSWARLVGKAMDLGLLGLALTGKRARITPIYTAAAAALGFAALDVWVTRRSRRATDSRSRAPVRVTGAITIGRSVEDVYRFWRALPNLARFMGHVESVNEGEAGLSHWRAKGPTGHMVEWDAELVDDRPGQRIAWKTVQDAPWPHEGEVRFAVAPGGQGTQVTVMTEYRIPRGKLGQLLGKVPEVQMQNDLRRCKQLLELGEVVHSDASIARGMHPARPTAGRGGAR